MSDLSFARDIFPLFRARDIEEMSFAFDLSSYEDVCENAEEIHSRLADGTMPCDAPWSEEDVERVRRRHGGLRAPSPRRLCVRRRAADRYSAGRDDGSLSDSALSLSSDVSQRFLMSREASGAASLPTPLNVTSSSTRTDVPPGDGVRV